METNALKIYNKRKQHYSSTSNRVYSLIGTAYDEHKESENRYSTMIQNFKNEMNSGIEIDVIFGILIFSILLALLLWVFVSVPLADFGFSILASVLLMIVMGIATAIVSSLGVGGDGVRYLFIVAVIVIFVLAFLGNQNKRLNQILKIVSHYLVPLFLFLIYLQIEDKYLHYDSNISNNTDKFHVFTAIFITGVLVSIFVYKRIFKNYRLLPK